MNFKTEEKRIKASLKHGLTLFRTQDYQSALEEFQSVLMLDPDNAVANTIGGACLTALGRFAEAEPLARRGVRLTPDLALPRALLWEILAATERSEEAESELWAAVAATPHDAYLRVVLGRWLFFRNSSEEAMSQLKQAIRIKEDDGEAHLLLGMCLTKELRVDQARLEIERALELSPDDHRALTYLGILSIIDADDLLSTPPKLESYRRAVHLLGRSIEINTNDKVAAMCLRIAEESIERISKPTELRGSGSRWYLTTWGSLLVWIGLASLAIVWSAIPVIMDRYHSLDDFWLGAAALLIFELMAFGVMCYLRRDFSALPPSIVTVVERVTKRSITPVAQPANRTGSR